MVDFAKGGAEIMRDYVTDGVPASGPWSPAKADLRTWMETVEGAFGENAGGITSDVLTTYGYQAGMNNGTPTSTPTHSADLNTFIGTSAGRENTTGFAQTFLGHGAGVNTTTGDSNTYLGAQTGIAGTTAKWNVAIGVDALFANIYGWNNVVIGHHAGTALAFADGQGEVVCIGAEAMRGVGGIQCTVIGYRAGYNINASGTNNTMLGRLAGFQTTSGGYNVYLGNNAGFSNVSGGSNIFVGNTAGYYESGGGKLIIDNGTRGSEAADRAGAILYGEMGSVGAQFLRVNGSLVIGDGSLPSGGVMGAGTINAKEVYNDGAALTCFGIEYLVDGEVDIAKWDAFLPEGRKNELVREFVAMTKRFDPRDPAQYIAHMRDTRSLPGMPTQDEWKHNTIGSGELFNRLWLSEELLASAFATHVENVHVRLGAIEARLN